MTVTGLVLKATRAAIAEDPLQFEEQHGVGIASAAITDTRLRLAGLAADGVHDCTGASRDLIRRTSARPGTIPGSHW